MNDYSYKRLKDVFSDYIPPFAFVDKNAFNRNISLAIKRSGTKQIRVASKSVRSVEALKFLEKSLGQKFSGLMTYHLDESIELLELGFKSALMGYPQIINEDQGQKIATLAREGKHLISMVDSESQIRKINDLGKKLGHVFKVCVDIDLSLTLPGLNFGVFRSPLKNVELNKKIFEIIRECDNVNCVGVMGYEAQIAGVGDSLGKGKIFDFIVGILKKMSKGRIYKYREEVVELASSMFDLEFVNGGGTGSMEMTAEDRAVTEITVGSAFYCPHLFDRYDEPFEPSAGYAVQVCRIPNDSMVTCHGGGYVASGACGTDKVPAVFLPKDLDFDKNEMFGEVQTPLHKKTDLKLNIGDPVFLRHAKAGELMERFNHILVFDGDVVTDRWKTYRGEGYCYL